MSKSQEMKAYVQCTHCGGTGSIELTGVYAETLRLLIRHPDQHGAALAKLAGCTGEAMCNRLKELEYRGLAVGTKFGRMTKWKHKTL